MTRVTRKVNKKRVSERKVGVGRRAGTFELPDYLCETSILYTTL